VAFGLVVAEHGGRVLATPGRRSPGAASATRGDLRPGDLVERPLAYADVRPLRGRLPGIVTSLPAAGDVVARGGVLYRVDTKPVVLLYGTLPAWRELREGVSDGRDVRQLQRNLVALGYDPNGYVEADGRFGWATEAAVERWQAAMHLDVTGRVGLGRIVFLPGPRRVSQLHARLGAASVDDLVMTTSSTRPALPVALAAAR
jgi:hypothetical protein